MTIQELLAQTLNLPLDSISDDASMKTVPEWDSLKHMEVILSIERHFKVELTGDEIADMTSLSAINTILEQRGLC